MRESVGQERCRTCRGMVAEGNRFFLFRFCQCDLSFRNASSLVYYCRLSIIESYELSYDGIDFVNKLSLTMQDATGQSM